MSRVNGNSIIIRWVILSDVLFLQKSRLSLVEAEQQSTESATHLNDFKLKTSVMQGKHLKVAINNCSYSTL